MAVILSGLSCGWADRARALIDDAVVPVEHTTIDDLQALFRQLSRALQGQQYHPVLSAVMRRPNRF
jgi:hypothetical protein